MKFLFVLLSVITVSSHASIIDSNYDSRHQALIKASVERACGETGVLHQKSSTIKEDRVDHGVVDLTYTTVFTTPKYQIEVVSEKSDFYDHDAMAWGYYQVHSVNCDLR